MGEWRGAEREGGSDGHFRGVIGGKAEWVPLVVLELL